MFQTIIVFILRTFLWKLLPTKLYQKLLNMYLERATESAKEIVRRRELIGRELYENDRDPRLFENLKWYRSECTKYLHMHYILSHHIDPSILTSMEEEIGTKTDLLTVQVNVYDSQLVLHKDPEELKRFALKQMRAFREMQKYLTLKNPNPNI
jgi:hypothetical protein